MTQTTGAISSREFVIETSPDGTTWTDRSGETVQIIPAAGTRKSGQINTADGDLPITTFGKREAQIVTVEHAYTEGASDLTEISRISWEAATDFYIRYAPKGGQTGEFRFTTLAGKVVRWAYPQMNAGSGDPVLHSFDLFVPGLVKAVA